MSLPFTPIHRDDLCQVTADMSGTHQPAGSSYLIMPHNSEQNTAIKFHYGPPGTVKGISNESLVAILIHRITTLQSNVPCGENEVALKCLDEVMEALKQRSKRRLVHMTTPTGRNDAWLRKRLTEGSSSPLEDIGKDYFNIWTQSTVYEGPADRPAAGVVADPLLNTTPEVLHFLRMSRKTFQITTLF
jgi:hypothetical protein